MVLAGRLVVTPQPAEHVFKWQGEASYGALLQGLIGVNGWVPPGESEGLYTVGFASISRVA